MSIAPSVKPRTTPNILLIDDNKMGLSARKIVLEELGYSIVASNSPIQALDQLAAQTFDMVITDYKMPNMDGIELISRVRSSHPAMPVILISGFADTLGLDEQSTGADVVIQKSSHEVPNLIRSVKNLLKRKKGPSSQSAGLRPVRKKAV